MIAIGRATGLTRHQKKVLLEAVAGWAYLLLLGRGEKYVASASLGPNSTNNIAEFTAILEVVTHAVILGVTQLLVHTDSFLAVQYYENTCSKDR